MTELAKHTLKVKYTGGSADNHLLHLYDGATSIQGVAQALQIATHAYINDDIVSRATALRGASMYLKPARQGSFLYEIVTVIEQYPATSAITSLVFYDFIKFSLGKAVGLITNRPATPQIQKLVDKDETFFDELGETLEGSLQRAHRPIADDIECISIGRPRSGLISLDQGTHDWVNTRDEIPVEVEVTGNVTRYNAITRNGRIFIDQLKRIVPFKLDGDFQTSTLSWLTWSLHGSNTDLPKQLQLRVRYVKSAHGQIKRLLIAECSRLEN